MTAVLRAQDAVSFGRMMRAERKVLGKTQGDVAAIAGVTRQTVADLESGKNVGTHVLFAVLASTGKLVAISDARPDYETMRQLLQEGDDD